MLKILNFIFIFLINFNFFVASNETEYCDQKLVQIQSECDLKYNNLLKAFKNANSELKQIKKEFDYKFNTSVQMFEEKLENLTNQVEDEVKDLVQFPTSDLFVTQEIVWSLPRPPTNLRISDVTTTSVRLLWSYDIFDENVVYFVVQYKPRYANQEYSEISGITTFFYIVGSLTPYTEYEFNVVAVNASRRGLPSAPAFVTTRKTNSTTTDSRAGAIYPYNNAVHQTLKELDLNKIEGKWYTLFQRHPKDQHGYCAQLNVVVAEDYVNITHSKGNQVLEVSKLEQNPYLKGKLSKVEWLPKGYAVEYPWFVTQSEPYFIVYQVISFAKTEDNWVIYGRNLSNVNNDDLESGIQTLVKMGAIPDDDGNQGYNCYP